MLTIQPNFYQKSMHSIPVFGHRNQSESYYYADESDMLDTVPEEDILDLGADGDDRITSKNEDLKDFRDGVNQTIANIKGLEEEFNLPDWVKEPMGVLYTLGAALVAGIGTKFGFSKTSEYLGELANKNSIKKASKNVKGSLKKLGAAFGKCIDTVKNTSFYKAVDKKMTKLSDSFKKTALGKGLKSLQDKVSKNSLVIKTKEFFARMRNINSSKVVDRTGDVIGTATGVSTAAVGVIDPEKKERLEG